MHELEEDNHYHYVDAHFQQLSSLMTHSLNSYSHLVGTGMERVQVHPFHAR